MYVSALIVYSVVFYILYVDGPPTHPEQYLWHRLPYATSRPRLAYRRFLSFSVCMCFCLLADVSLDQTNTTVVLPPTLGSFGRVVCWAPLHIRGLPPLSPLV